MAAGEQAIDQHYGGTDISARILAALSAAGKDPARLARSDLAAIDEFHGGGIASTRDLARYAGLAPDMSVLDIGCGIGGPARTLAAEFGCRVSGIDLTREFVRAAEMLTARVGMAAQCDFRHGNGTTLPWPDATRVLKPGGRFAFESVLAGSGEPVHLPCFWAARAELSHLVTRDELERLLESAGLDIAALDETTASVIAQGRKRKAAVEQAGAGKLSIAVIVPDDVGAKMDNALRNNEQGRTRTVKGVCRRRD